MRKLLTILFLLLSAATYAQLTVRKPVMCEYRVYWVYSDGNIYGTSNNGGTFIKKWTMPAGVTSWSFVTGGFNYFIALDQDGNYWNSHVFTDPTDGIYQVTTDSTGAALTGLIYANSYSSTECIIRADSSLWYGDVDTYSFFYAGGNVGLHQGTTMKFTQLSAPGLKFKKVQMGGNVIMALAMDGSVYKWVAGNKTPTHYTPARPAIDVFSGAVDAWGYIMPDATGDQTMGYPYMAGTQFGLWNGSGTLSTPTSLKTLWGMTVPIKEFSIGWNTIHYIDSAGKLWGLGWNSFGEVGNGQEFVGRYDYSTYPNYNWTGNNGEHGTGNPQQIGTDTDWKHIWSVPWFGFYKIAQKNNDSTYAWGRNKSNVQGNGQANGVWTVNGDNVDEFHFNVLDVLLPTLITPISAPTVAYNWTPPTIDAANQSIRTPYTSIVTTGHMLRGISTTHPAGNGIDTIDRVITSHTWTKKSGPTRGNMVNTSSATLTLNSLVNGSYVFRDLVTDNHSGADTLQVKIDVNGVNLLNRTAGGRIKWKN